MFTTMCPKEQQTSDNQNVKDNCFNIEIFDKFSFSGILNPISAGGGGGGIHPSPGFSLAIATNKNRSTPNFLTFKFHYRYII